MRGVILYGPPASGKDTITTALHELDSRYVLFPRLKTGVGKSAGYRVTTEAEVDTLRARGDVVWENRRYGSLYVVDKPGLLEHLAEHITVVHLCQVDAVAAITSAIPDVTWLVVYLATSRDVAIQRIAAHGDLDAADRLAAWDATAPLADADLVIDTAATSVARAVDQIRKRLFLVKGWPRGVPLMGYREAFHLVQRRPGMYLLGTSFEHFASFITGCDQADRDLLDGWREWLIVRLEDGAELAWFELVLDIALPDKDRPRRPLTQDEDRLAVQVTFRLLNEFFDERDEIGPAAIKARHQRWLAAQPWYTAKE